jgi:general secretion pathway protein E
MGVEPFLITSTLNAVLAQRLVRRLCPDCREPYAPTPEALDALGLQPFRKGVTRLFHARGCERCGHSGFKGRLALLELLIVDEDVSRLVLARSEAREIERAAIAASMRTMLADGLVKAAQGQTTIEEVLRVTREA